MDDVRLETPARPGTDDDDPVTVDVTVVDDDLDAVYRRTYGSLVRVAYLLVDTREQAEEVVQDAWIGVIQGLGRFEGRSSLKTWIFLNGCRRVHRRRRVASLWRDDPRIPGGGTGDPAGGSDDPLDHVADLVRRLPSPQREAVVLRYYLQATDAEIAELLGIALGTVKSTLHRARTRLRQELT